VTDEEILFLQGLCPLKRRKFGLRGKRLTDLRQFDEFVDHLKQLEEAGWIELEVTPAEGSVSGHQRRYCAAAARCTDRCREALGMLGSA
jgi:hypothetical protein